MLLPLCPAGICTPVLVPHLPSPPLLRWGGVARRYSTAGASEGLSIPGLGHGMQKSYSTHGGKDEECASTTLYFVDGLLFLESLWDELLVPTGTTSQGGRKSPLMTASPCSLLDAQNHKSKILNIPVAFSDFMLDFFCCLFEYLGRFR